MQISSFFLFEIKQVEVNQERLDIILSEMANIHAKGDPAHELSHYTTLHLNCTLTNEETTKHQTAAGRLAWIETRNYPISACLSSIVLKRPAKRVALLNSCHAAYEKVAVEKLAA